MKLKHKLSRLINTRNSLVDFLRDKDDNLKKDDVILNMDSTLSLCGEISRLNEEINRIKELPLKDGDKEILTYSIQFPSDFNKAYNSAIKRPARRKKIN